MTTPTPITVELRPYSPGWADEARAETMRLSGALEGTILVVHHIGSTAIPPICAKPIIDLMPIVGSVSDVDEQEAVFRLLGYRCWGEYGIAGRRYLTLDDPDTGKRRFQLHCYEPGSEEIDRHLAFRDYLRANPRKAQEYENEKRRCQQLNPHNSHAYADAKSEWIQDQLPEALASFCSSR
jgi:GrpB-like predicted nucleotidyltransferase (UPF0157 family)